MQKCEKFCQSCLMPLENFKNSGTNADQSKSDTYCYLCFENGKFTKPDCTMQEMLDISIAAIKKDQKMSKLKKWMIIKSYPSMLAKARRWR